MNITIPKGCSCAPSVECGSYDNQVELQTPEFMRGKTIGCFEIRDITCVDACLVEVVQALWGLKVFTTGCCCGHNKQDGYVGILEGIGRGGNE